MIWFLESHSFLVAVSASFLLGILLDMLLKKSDMWRLQLRLSPPYLSELMERLYTHLPVF